MTRSIFFRQACLATAVAFAVACGTTSPNHQTPAVAFVSPQSGAMLNGSNGTVVGSSLVVAVTAQATNVSAGDVASLTVNAGTPIVATVSPGGGLTFPSVTLTGGSNGVVNALALSLTDARGTATAAINVTVTLSTSSGVCPVSISPADGTLFNESGDAGGTGLQAVRDENPSVSGAQARIVVTVGGPCSDGGTPVTLNIGQTPLPAVLLQNGTATFDQILLTDTPFAALTDPSQRLTLTANVGSGPLASSASVGYAVDSVTPTATIVTPDGGTYTSAQDVDVTAPGIQINVSGTTRGFGPQLTAGVPQPFQIVNGSGVAYPIFANSDAGLNLAPNGAFGAEITLDPADGGAIASEALVFQAVSFSGNAAAQTSSVNVGAEAPNLIPPTIAFSKPKDGASVNNGFDEVATVAGLQFPFTLTTTFAPAGSPIVLCSSVAPTATAAACPFLGGAFLLRTLTASGGTVVADAVTLGDDGAAPFQTITAQVSDNGLAPGQAAIQLQVHTLVPIVESYTFAGVYRDSAGRQWLNSVNSPGGTTNLSVTLDSVDSYLTGDAGGQVTVSVQGGSAPLVTAPIYLDGGVPSSELSFSLLSDGVQPLVISASDRFGNTSSNTQTVPVATSFNVFVKRSLPSCNLFSPSQTGYFNVQNNGGISSAGTVQVPVVVNAQAALANDANGAVISGSAAVAEDGGAIGTASVSTLSATVETPSPQGAGWFGGTVTDPAGNPPQACTAPFELTVATVGPSVTLTVQPDSTSPQTDGGTQVYTDTRNVSVQVTATGIADGQAVSLAVDTLSPSAQATVSGGSASGTIYVPNGLHTITAQATDSAGNQGVGAGPVLVQGAGCDLILVSPTLATAAGGGSVVYFNGTTGQNIALRSSCLNTPVALSLTQSGGGANVAAGSTDGSGNVSFPLSLPDGTTGTFTANITGGDTVGPINFISKLAVPTIGAISPPTTGLLIVAAQDNLNLGDAGVQASLLSSSANAYATFAVTGLGNLGPADNNNNVGSATLTQTFAGNSAAPIVQRIASGVSSATFTNVALPANSYPGGGMVAITVTDTAGNTSVQSWTVVTDAIPPTAPAPTASMLDQRKATVQVTWATPALNGASANQGYELRYLVSSLDSPSLATPTSGQWDIMPVVNAGISGTATSQSVTNLPTLNQYAFELRAVDQVGNQSALAAVANTTSLAQGVANSWQTLTLQGPDQSASADFGYRLITGDFNGDGRQDLAISAPSRNAGGTTPGSVYVLQGTSSLSSVSGAWPNSSLVGISLGDGQNDFFGVGSAAIDVNHDGFDDLIVGSPNWNNGANLSAGRADIFFGSATGLSTTPSVTIYGDSSQKGRFGSSISPLGDMNGDGFADFLVGAPGEGSNFNGATYLFLGRSTWPAPPQTPTIGPSSPVPASRIYGDDGDAVGAGTGSVPLGNLSGAAKQDFTVGAPGGGINSGSGIEYGINGGTALDAGYTPGLAASSSPIFILTNNDPQGGTGCLPGSNYQSGVDGCFGATAIGGVHFTDGGGFANGASLPDLVVGDPDYFGFYLFPMTSAGPASSTTEAYDYEGFQNFPWSLVAADLNADGTPDILAGINDPMTSTVYVYLNYFRVPYLPRGGVSATIVGPSGSFFGYAVAAGNLEGLTGGQVDFAVSDPVASYVNIYY